MILNKKILDAFAPPGMVELGGKKYIIPAMVEVPKGIDLEKYLIEHRKAYKFKKIKEQEWKVKSSSLNVEYTVKFKDDYTCSCPGFKYHGSCKHIKEISDGNKKLH